MKFKLIEFMNCARDFALDMFVEIGEDIIPAVSKKVAYYAKAIMCAFFQEEGDQRVCRKP